MGVKTCGFWLGVWMIIDLFSRQACTTNVLRLAYFANTERKDNVETAHLIKPRLSLVSHAEEMGVEVVEV